MFVPLLAQTDQDPTQEPGLPVAVISLPDTPARRAAMVATGVPASWLSPYWPATDMRRARAAALDAHWDRARAQALYGRDLRPAEVGCALSHRAVYAAQLAGGHDLVLVCEDDLVPQEPGFEAIVTSYAQMLRPVAARGEAFLCNLGLPEAHMRGLLSRPLRGARPPMSQGSPPELRLYCDAFRPIWRANAYFLSAAAAARILNDEPKVALVADDWSQRIRMGIFDRVYVPARPIFAQETAHQSTVQVPQSAPAPGLASPQARPPIGPRIRASLAFRAANLRARVMQHIPYALRD